MQLILLYLEIPLYLNIFLLLMMLLIMYFQLFRIKKAVRKMDFPGKEKNIPAQERLFPKINKEQLAAKPSAERMVYFISIYQAGEKPLPDKKTLTLTNRLKLRVPDDQTYRQPG